ncbi:Uncharacterised protein [Clostridium tetanomorphum]|nr:Uncharacterised protein [Clostridium tetanomorphum]
MALRNITNYKTDDILRKNQSMLIKLIKKHYN